MIYNYDVRKMIEVLDEILEHGDTSNKCNLTYFSKDGREFQKALGYVYLNPESKEATIEDAEGYIAESGESNVIVAVVPDGCNWAVLKKVKK